MFNNQNYQQNMMGGFGIPQGTGYQFNPGNQPQPKMMNTLSQEEIQRLVQKENQFSLQITETERLRAVCNHRRPDGMGDAIVEDQNGRCRCQICGYEFIPLDATQTSEEMLKESVDNILDILQTIKLLYINMPVDAAKEYYQIIPLIEKIPKLFDYAAKDYAKHDSFNAYGYNTKNMSTMSLFQMLTGAFGGGMGFGQPQQFAQPGQPQPQYDPNMVNMGQFGAAGYAAPMSNGFGYNMGMNPGYAAQTAGYQYDPNQQMAAGQVAPTAAQATTDGKTVEVNSTFKA